MADPLEPPKYVDNNTAPELYVSYLSGIGLDGPNVRLTFVSTQADHSQNLGMVRNVVTARLVMSTHAANQMADFLRAFLATAQLNATQKPSNQPMQ